MLIPDSILRPDEKTALVLRSLYSSRGYRPFKMSKFEEYELYMKHKEFLRSDGIITFTDTDGKLLALKPDVTLSIIRNARDIPGEVQRVYYTENVYRISQSSRTYKEIMQTGLECIGDTTQADTAQVLSLAEESARWIHSEYRIVLSHIGFVQAYLKDLGLGDSEEVLEAISAKKTDLLLSLCSPDQREPLLALMESYPNPDVARDALLPYCPSGKAAMEDFCSLWAASFPQGCRKATVDFSLANTTGYYSGIVFQGYIAGVSVPVISGGQYDVLMQKLGRKSRAVGFAVYLDALERLEAAEDSGFVNIALPKGRLGDKVYAMFEQAGYDCPEIREENRKLVFENPQKKLRFFWVKPSDVAIYVALGAADIGVAGYDILLEYKPDVYELRDLGVGKCRMAVAGKKDFVDDSNRKLRVATKFSGIVRKYYADRCRDIDIIHLNGSIELAPILGLSDVIVDIVETGKTLQENGLEVKETIVDLSARLIANKAAYRFKQASIEKIAEAMVKQTNR